MTQGLTPWQRYSQCLEQGGFTRDPAQDQAVQQLQALHDRLRQQQTPGAFWKKWLRRRRQPLVKGLYLWGGVGRGKTWLMDLFCNSLPAGSSMRTHFHRFMKRVHEELSCLRKQKNPLESVAERLANEAQVICFDEFFVADIADAMILGRLLDALFRRGVVLVATSNIAPEGLYKDGLQRARFLPAIDLVLEHMHVMELTGSTDYRARILSRAGLYHYPLNRQSADAMASSFAALVPEEGYADDAAALEIEGRLIPCVKVCGDMVWFSFADLCDGPRSQNDYIELAREFHTVFLSEVPMMGADAEDKARRFIYMVDEFYDRGVKLVMSAEVALPDLYSGCKLAFEFQRTASRLQEMQSWHYLDSMHMDRISGENADIL